MAMEMNSLKLSEFSRYVFVNCAEDVIVGMMLGLCV